jgi:hypothetical protein
MLDRPDTAGLKRIAGSNRDTFNKDVITATLGCLWSPTGQSEEQRAHQYEAATVAMMAFRPTDEIEAMIVGQALAMHSASMECSRRAMIPEQPFEVAQGFRKAAASSSRTFIELLAALDRKRGKAGQQRVTVEHVHVHSGGQAIVGAVTPGALGGGGGVPGTIEAEPRVSAPELAHDTSLSAVISPLRGEGPEHALVFAAGDAKRQVPASRRKIDRPEND